jgi:tetratricopeptide (TPR) repeat protein
MKTLEQRITQDLYNALAEMANEEAESLPPSPFKSTEIRAKELLEDAKKNIENFHYRLSEGINYLSKEGIFPEKAPMKDDKRALLIEKISSSENVSKTLQETFAVSDEIMLRAYECGSHLYHKQRYSEAGNVFLVLTFLNPLIASFWIGLGMSEEKTSAHQSAGLAYLVALEMNPEDLEPAFDAVRCFLTASEHETAHNILQQVIEEAGTGKKYAKARDQAQCLLKNTTFINKP